MAELFGKVEGYLERLSKDIQSYLKESFETSNMILCAYHPDFGGIPAQAVVNKISAYIRGGNEPKYKPITFENTGHFIRAFDKLDPKEVMLFDFEPHADVYNHIIKAKRVGIFGHHPIRKDMEDTKNNEKVSYFNPHSVIPDYVSYDKTEDGVTKNTDYDRGAPILLPLSMAAKKMKVDAKFVTSFGLRGYGFTDLAKGYEEKNKIKPELGAAHNAISGITMLTSYKIDYEIEHKGEKDADGKRMKSKKTIVEELGGIGSYTSGLGVFYGEAVKRNIVNFCDRRSIESYQNAITVGPAIVIPIKKYGDNGDREGFEQIKAILNNLEGRMSRNGLEKRYPLKIYVDMDDPKTRKISLRAPENKNLLPILDDAHKGIESPKNYGGHKTAAGILCQTIDAPLIVSNVINGYMGENRFSDKDMAFLGTMSGQYQTKLF